MCVYNHSFHSNLSNSQPFFDDSNFYYSYPHNCQFLTDWLIHAVPSTTTGHSNSCPLHAKHFKSASALWNHINTSIFTDRNFQRPLVCSFSSRHQAYHKHFALSGCQRPINGGSCCCCGSIHGWCSGYDCPAHPFFDHLPYIQLPPVSTQWGQTTEKLGFTAATFLEFHGGSDQLEHQSFSAIYCGWECAICACSHLHHLTCSSSC